MSDFRAANHVMGLELQLEELIEQRARAEVQGRADDVGRLGAEIEALQLEMAAAAEATARRAPGHEDPGPELHDGPVLG